MKRFCVILIIVLGLSQGARGQWIAADSVFMMGEEEAVAVVTAPQVPVAVTGDWGYKGAAVDMTGSNFIAKVGKPLSASKVRKKLGKAFKKARIDKNTMRLALQPDGTFMLSLLGQTMAGTYDYDAATRALELRWRVPLTHATVRMPARVKLTGKNKMQLLVDVDPLLRVFRTLSLWSDNDAIGMLAQLSRNYDHVLVGMELKR